MKRRENQPMLIVPLLQHTHRDHYWKHASVCEDFGAIDAACLVVGGWNDAYSNAIPRLMAGLRSSCKAIIGPWIHKYPHFSMVGPRIGFLQESLRWWDFWLKGEPTGVMREDRKSTRLNSSHMSISYAVFCLKKKNRLGLP